MGDRAAARADRADVDPRRLDRQPDDVPLVEHGHLAVRDQARVEARPAHVGRDRAREPELARQLGGRDRSGNRAGDHRLEGPLDRLAERHGAAARAGDRAPRRRTRSRRAPPAAARGTAPCDAARTRRSTVVQVRSYSRYSPEMRCDSEISPSKPSRRSSRSTASSCCRVRVGVEECDRDGVDAALGERRERLGQAREVERLVDRTVGEHALGDRRAQAAGDERRRRRSRRGRTGRRGRRGVPRAHRGSPASRSVRRWHRAARAERSARPSSRAGRATTTRRASGLSAASTAPTTPRSGASGQVGSLPTTTSPVTSSHQTRSVNVPPTSTPRSVAMPRDSTPRTAPLSCVETTRFAYLLCLQHSVRRWPPSPHWSPHSSRSARGTSAVRSRARCCGSRCSRSRRRSRRLPRGDDRRAHAPGLVRDDGLPARPRAAPRRRRAASARSCCTASAELQPTALRLAERAGLAVIVLPASVDGAEALLAADRALRPDAAVGARARARRPRRHRAPGRGERRGRARRGRSRRGLSL